MQLFPHGDKLDGRIKNLAFIKEHPLLIELRDNYNILKKGCLNITVTTKHDLNKIIDYMNNYLTFFAQDRFEKIKSNSQSKIFPSVLEEFMYLLFVSIVQEPLVCGSCNIPIRPFFKPYEHLKECSSYEECFNYETVNSDFVIGLPKLSRQDEKWKIIPLVVIENKKYPDKTMRKTIDDTSEKLETFSTDCLYLAVVYQLSKFFNSEYTPPKNMIDQIYGLQEGNDETDHGLRTDMIFKLFSDVAEHLIKIQKTITIEERCARGYIMDRPTVDFDSIDFNKLAPKVYETQF